MSPHQHRGTLGAEGHDPKSAGGRLSQAFNLGQHRRLCRPSPTGVKVQDSEGAPGDPEGGHPEVEAQGRCLAAGSPASAEGHKERRSPGTPLAPPALIVPACLRPLFPCSNRSRPRDSVKNVWGGGATHTTALTRAASGQKACAVLQGGGARPGLAHPAVQTRAGHLTPPGLSFHFCNMRAPPPGTEHSGAPPLARLHTTRPAAHSQKAESGRAHLLPAQSDTRPQRAAGLGSHQAAGPQASSLLPGPRAPPAGGAGLSTLSWLGARCSATSALTSGLHLTLSCSLYGGPL